MKPNHVQEVKKDLNCVSRGTRNSVRFLFGWLNGAPDPESTKRRLLVTVGVPAGFMILGSEYPGIAVTGAFLLFSAAVIWFSRVEEQQMTIHSTDFLGPFEVDGRIVDFPGLLSHLARKHPRATLQQLADALHDDFRGPDLSNAQIASQMRLHRVTHPSVPDPSPASGPPPASKSKDAGQSASEAGSGENSQKRGSGKTWLALTGFASKVKGYAEPSPKKEKEESGGEVEEQGGRRVGEEPERGGSAGAEGSAPDHSHAERVGEAPVPDSGGRQEDPGGVPHQGDRRSPAAHEAVAERA